MDKRKVKRYAKRGLKKTEPGGIKGFGKWLKASKPKDKKRNWF